MQTRLPGPLLSCRTGLLFRCCCGLGRPDIGFVDNKEIFLKKKKEKKTGLVFNTKVQTTNCTLRLMRTF